MKPVLVAWASKSGRTENLAQRVLEVLERERFAVDLKAVKAVDWNRMDDWSALVFGSPTYGAGDLHPDWDQPERRLRDLDLSGRLAAVFGCGSPSYATPWWAVDILANRLKNGGAKLLVEPLKVDTTAGFRVRDADAWIEALASALGRY